MAAERQALDARAFSVMLLLTALWGFQQVVIKLTAADVPLVLQAGLRSIIATLLLLGWAWGRGIALFERDGTLGAGMLAGVLFAGEFIFIYAGLGHTTASRMVVFIYLAPIFTALGVHLLVPGEHLRAGQWTGVAIAFGGVALAFSDGFAAGRAGTWLGDLFGVLGALFWAATTVLIRATSLTRVTATKALFYQLVVSAAVLPLASVLMGESGVREVTPLAVAGLLYQGAIVAFASYLAWFWLLTRYLASRLAVFSFLTPLFGVLAGVLVLGETLTPPFAFAALLVGGGIVLVNRRSG